MADLDEEDVTEDEAALPGEDQLRSDLLAARDEMKEVAAANIVSLLEPLNDADKAVLTDDVEFAEDLASGLREGLRTGVDGWLDDRLAFNKPWGFDVKEISVPTMIWHGSADLKVPFSEGQWLASHVPGASAHIEQGEGHVSIGLSALDHMLDELASAGSAG
jgi:pimeloyl-ACP methyl ester carboxylesterase